MRKNRPSSYIVNHHHFPDTSDWGCLKSGSLDPKAVPKRLQKLPSRPLWIYKILISDPEADRPNLRSSMSSWRWFPIIRLSSTAVKWTLKYELISIMLIKVSLLAGPWKRDSTIGLTGMRLGRAKNEQHLTYKSESWTGWRTNGQTKWAKVDSERVNEYMIN